MTSCPNPDGHVASARREYLWFSAIVIWVFVCLNKPQPPWLIRNQPQRSFIDLPRYPAGVRRLCTQNHELKCYRTRQGRVNKQSRSEPTIAESRRDGANCWAPAKEMWAPSCQICQLFRSSWVSGTFPNGLKHCARERKLDSGLSSLQGFPAPASSSRSGSHLSAVDPEI